MPLVTRFANQGNLYKQTTEPADWQDGDLWSDTTNDKLYLNINGTATEVGGDVVADEVVMPYSTTIGDYSDGTESSAKGLTTSTYSQTSTASGVNLCGSGCAGQYASVKILSGSSSIDSYVKKIKLTAHYLGSPTGNVTIGIMNASNTVLESADLDVTTWTTSNTTQEITLTNAVKLEENFRVYCYFPNGSSGNDFRPRGLGSDTANYNSETSQDGSSWSDVASFSFSFQFDSTPNIGYFADDDTGTVAETAQVTNPEMVLDCGGSSINIGACAIWFNAATTETQVKIRGSTDTTFTDAENLRTINLTEITTGQYSYLRFNLKNFRYLQIYGSSGSSVVLAINEIKYETYTDAEITETHGHIGIDGDTTGLANNGT